MDLTTEENTQFNSSLNRTLNNKSGASDRDTKEKFYSIQDKKEQEKRLLQHRALRYSSKEWESDPRFV
jgi:hypothetical protein